MQSTLKNTLREFISSIGLIYFFILPVYIPLRTLGIEFKSYDLLVSNPTDLILYFLQIMLLIACNSILLSICYEWISKHYFKDEKLIVHWYRTIALIYAGFFIVSSYFVLHPSSLFYLYLWSGVHYFIISFFQILIRSEIHHSQNKKISTVKANNYFGLALNFSAVIALLIFSLFYSSNKLEYYGIYSFFLEFGLLFYLIFGRKYYVSVLYAVKQCSFQLSMIYIVLSVLALFFASITSLIFVMSDWVGPLLSIVFVLYFYKKLKLEIDKRDLRLIINVGLGYGLVLSALSGSVLTYLIKERIVNYDAFNFAYSSEPVFSVIVGLVLTYLLMKKGLKITRDKLTNSIFILNCIMPAILGMFLLAYFYDSIILYSLVAMFILYAILEYLSLFYVRQIAQQDSYKEKQGAKLTNFNSVVLNGLCPSLMYLFIFCLTKFTSIELNKQLMIAMSVLAIFSITYNFYQKYVVKYEF